MNMTTAVTRATDVCYENAYTTGHNKRLPSIFCDCVFANMILIIFPIRGERI
jgi:hypothetical protein